jgi:crotonobetainyl-CoA:carnitine CoA-transferase CaiB-like acyl-CoA transferase
MSHTPSSQPLDHVTVVSLEHAIAAPFCTRQLADLGARVIKVERPGEGDFARGYDKRARGASSHFVWVNRSKESLALDLKQPTHLSALKHILGHADVLVQNLAPGATARMGLDAASLRALHPRLIVCDISGYGLDGPYRDKKAYDTKRSGLFIHHRHARATQQEWQLHRRHCCWHVRLQQHIGGLGAPRQNR